jgi:hypothetical protein
MHERLPLQSLPASRIKAFFGGRISAAAYRVVTARTVPPWWPAARTVARKSVRFSALTSACPLPAGGGFTPNHR